MRLIIMIIQLVISFRFYIDLLFSFNFRSINWGFGVLGFWVFRTGKAACGVRACVQLKSVT